MSSTWDDGPCLCGKPVAATNTFYCHDCLEASEYEDMEDGLEVGEVETP